jgi:hypothetical protein
MQITTRQRTLNLLIVTFISLTMTSGAVAADTPVALCQGEGLTDPSVRGILQAAGHSVYLYCQGMDTAEFTQQNTTDETGASRSTCQGEGLTDASIRGILQAAGHSVYLYCQGATAAELTHLGIPDLARTARSCQGEGLIDGFLRGTFEMTGSSC